MNKLKFVIYISTPLFILALTFFLLISNSNAHSLPDKEEEVSIDNTEINRNLIEQAAKHEFPKKHIDVLIYACLGTRQTEQILYILEDCNRLKILPEYDIRTRIIYFDEQNILDYEILSDYDILIVPGGVTCVYQYFWNGNDIKDWVYNGGGYIGICAGEILAIDGIVEESIFGPYTGLNMTPNVKRIAPDWVGPRNIKMTELGMEKLGLSGNQRFLLWNGSVFYYQNEPEQGEMIFAYYENNEEDPELELHGIETWLPSYNKKAAIIGDYFGDGRIILSAPHPEISSFNSIYKKFRILANMIKWAYKDDSLVPYVIGREDVLKKLTNADKLTAMSVLIEKDTFIKSLNIYLYNAHTDFILGIYSDNEEHKPGELITEIRFSAFANSGWCTRNLQEEIFFEQGSRIWLTWISESSEALYLSDSPFYNGDSGNTIIVNTDYSWPESGKLPPMFPEILNKEKEIASVYALGIFK